MFNYNFKLKFNILIRFSLQLYEKCHPIFTYNDLCFWDKSEGK